MEKTFAQQQEERRIQELKDSFTTFNLSRQGMNAVFNEYKKIHFSVFSLKEWTILFQFIAILSFCDRRLTEIFKELEKAKAFG